MTIKAEELKPCPFCGSAATNPIIECFDEETGEGGEFIYNPCCSNKDCILGHGHHFAFEDEEKSIKAWNTRTSPPVELIEELGEALKGLRYQSQLDDIVRPHERNDQQMEESGRIWEKVHAAISKYDAWSGK